jgi:SAM-dependent methyltransferase
MITIPRLLTRLVAAGLCLAAAPILLAQEPRVTPAGEAAPVPEPPAPAPEPPVPTVVPPALTEYMGRVIAPAMSYHGGASWLLRRLREDEEKPSLLLPELRLKPGQTVCDLGCGNGFHVLLMAPQVLPGGTVIGVDIQQEMLDDLEKRAVLAGVKNVKTLLGEVHDPKLAPDSCDLILLVDVYHEFSHPEPMLAAMRQALKPEGVVALVEFRGEDPEVPIKPEHKMTKAQIRKEWEANGFVLDREFDGLPWQHLMFWKRK